MTASWQPRLLHVLRVSMSVLGAQRLFIPAECQLGSLACCLALLTAQEQPAAWPDASAAVAGAASAAGQQQRRRKLPTLQRLHQRPHRSTDLRQRDEQNSDALIAQKAAGGKAERWGTPVDCPGASALHSLTNC